MIYETICVLAVAAYLRHNSIAWHRARIAMIALEYAILERIEDEW